MTATTKNFLFIVLLAGLAMMGYFASDMYLPAFPQMRSTLNTTPSLIELTLSVYMAGLAVGQLFYGIISDRIGRKTMLILGLALFIIASFGCYWSEHITSLLIFRVFQALGACATTVLWQAMVIDLYGEQGSHRLFALILPLLGVSPALAPSLGGLLTEQWGWRSIFMTLALIGIFIITIIFNMEETTTAESRAEHRIHISHILKNYQRLLTSMHYAGYVAIVCLATSCFFAYLTGSPFILKSLGLTAHEIGISYIPQTICFMLGGFVSKKVVDRLGAPTTLTIAIALSILCGLCMSGFALYGPAHASEVIVPFLLVAIANGMIYPTCLTIALNRFPKMSGTAAGLSGFLQAATAFVASSMIASLSNLGLLSIGGMILFLSTLNAIWYYVVYRTTLLNA